MNYSAKKRGQISRGKNAIWLLLATKSFRCNEPNSSVGICTYLKSYVAFDAVWIRDNPKEIQACALDSLFLKSLNTYAVQSFHPVHLHLVSKMLNLSFLCDVLIYNPVPSSHSQQKSEQLHHLQLGLLLLCQCRCLQNVHHSSSHYYLVNSLLSFCHKSTLLALSSLPLLYNVM